MRTGWTCKEAAVVLGVQENRVSQALDPALRKVALLWCADPTRTMLAILDMVNRLPANDGDGQDAEWHRRLAVQTGRNGRASAGFRTVR
jgi:hypothetical protein